MTDTPATEATMTLARQTLTGDLRDAMLDALRNIPKSWKRMTQDEQREWIDIITRRDDALTANAVNIIAADGREVVTVELEKVERRDTIRGTFSCHWRPETWIALGAAQGGTIQIIPASVDPYSGEQSPANPDPDQLSLIDFPVGDDEPFIDSKTLAAGG